MSESEKKNEKHVCPVCGKYVFTEKNSYESCPVCKWFDDEILTEVPTLRGFYHMNLIEAREAYKNGKEIQ